MRPHTLTGATLALLTMTAIPAWATCHDTASVREPDTAVQSESNADVDLSSEQDAHVRAESVAVEDLEEQKIEGKEDPAPEGYVTNVPADKIEDDADVGETTPATSTEQAEESLAAEVPASVDKETKAMKTDVASNGEPEELSAEEEQVSMAEAEEATEKVAELTENTVPAEGGQLEAATGGAEPEENWFGCGPDSEGAEGETCDESQVEATPDEADDPQQEYVELEGEKRSINLEIECDEDPNAAEKVEG